MPWTSPHASGALVFCFVANGVDTAWCDVPGVPCECVGVFTARLAAALSWRPPTSARNRNLYRLKRAIHVGPDGAAI